MPVLELALFWKTAALRLRIFLTKLLAFFLLVVGKGSHGLLAYIPVLVVDQGFFSTGH